MAPHSLHEERTGLIDNHVYTPGADGRCAYTWGSGRDRERCGNAPERHRRDEPLPPKPAVYASVSVCAHCGESIHRNSPTGKWLEDEDHVQPHICACPDPSQLDHEPVETLTSTYGPRSAGCRQCGHVIAQRDGVWASAEDGVFCPSSIPPIGSHRPDDEPADPAADAVGLAYCQHCGKTIHRDTRTQPWEDTSIAPGHDRTHCGASLEGFHWPREAALKPATVTSEQPLRCRHCGDEIHIGPDGKWHDTKADDSPQWCVPSADSHHHPLPSSEPAPDPDDPDETERLLAYAIRAMSGPAAIEEPDLPWEEARRRLKAWSEVRG